MATMEQYEQKFNDDPKPAVADMPELGEGVKQDFQSVLNMDDFAYLFRTAHSVLDHNTGKISVPGMVKWRVTLFRTLALADDGTRLVADDAALVPGDLQQLAVMRSGIDKIVLTKIVDFLEKSESEEGTKGPKAPSKNSSTISPEA